MRRGLRVPHGLSCIAAVFAVMALSACSTTPTPMPSEPIVDVNDATPETGNETVAPNSGDNLEAADPDTVSEADPSTPTPTTRPTAPLPGTIIDVPDADVGAAVEPVAPEPLLDRPAPFAALSGWADADHAPALIAFQQSCKRLLKRPQETPLHRNQPKLGTHADWAMTCRAADLATNPTPFFESLFLPVTLPRPGRAGEAGLLTGYYEPEVDVRSVPDAVFSEPILTVPTDDAVRDLPRSKLNAKSASVIAYGRPIEVFFLHIQGSGRLHFGDGRVVRAGYAANNGRKYRSIGRVLIDRGELTRNQSSKRNIEEWMDAAGPKAARALMNENPRYIFFSEQDIPDGQGPKGAMQVPLTAMGSIAVDPAHNPYGIPVFLNTRIPQEAGDFRGVATGLLVVTQDTGSAIKGPQRGDLFFGAGPNAGALAGVMKHPVRWTALVPRTLVERLERQEPIS